MAARNRTVEKSKPKHNRTIGTLRGLAGTADAGVRRVDAYRADPRVLEIEEGFNVRVKDDPELRQHIDSIKASIVAYLTREDPDNRVSEGGLLDVFPAIQVRVTEEGNILVVDGHCRTTAIRELLAEGWDIREIDLDPTKADPADRVVLMVRSSLGKSLLPIEKAEAFVRLVDNFGWTFPKIARNCGGVTTQRVEQLVLLGHAPQDIRDMVIARKVTADTAIEIVRKHREDPQEAVRFLENLVASKGARPVGKAQTQLAIPRKVQQTVFQALHAGSKSLAKQISDLEGQDGWEALEVQVSLPAGLVQQLLDLQNKDAAA